MFRKKDKNQGIPDGVPLLADIQARGSAVRTDFLDQ